MNYGFRLGFIPTYFLLTAMKNLDLSKLLRQLICIIYFFGGLIGLYILLPRLGLFNDSVIALSLFGLMMLQNVVAIYGSIRFWQNQVAGGQMLYWLSWTSVPVFSSTMISYHSIIGLGIAPIMRFVPGDYGMDLIFRFGYASALKWFPTLDVFQLGINLVPLVFIAIISQLINVHGSDD